MTTTSNVLSSTIPTLDAHPRLVTDPLGLLADATALGEVVYVSAGRKGWYLPTQPVLIDQVLRSRVFHQTAASTFDALLGNGLVSNIGPTHLPRRRMLQPSFQRSALVNLVQILVERADAHIATWTPGVTGDLQPALTQLTLDVVCATLLGSTTDYMQLGDAFEQIWEIFGTQQFAPKQGSNATLDRALATLNDVVYAMIAERRGRGPSAEPDVLDVLLAAQDAEIGTLSDKDIRDELVTLLVAGHETTATALSWALWLLSQHPEIQNSVAHEVTAVLGNRVPTWEDVPQLRLTRQVFDETLRLYPPAWLLFRRATEDVALGGVTIPKDTEVMISPYVVHRRDDVWQDAAHFHPERFAPGATPPPAGAYIPFGLGTRMCIGQHFALLEGVLLLARIIQRWSLIADPSRAVIPEAKLTLRPAAGVWFQLHPR